MRLGVRVRGLSRDERSVLAVETGEAALPVGARDAVILAVPPWAAADLLSGLCVPDDFRAIVNAHFRFDAPAGAPAMLGVIGGTAEWIFTFPGRVSVTVSGADAIVDKDREELARMIWDDVARALRISAPMPQWQIVKEKRATFAATPEQDAKTPAGPDRVAQPVFGRRLGPDRPARNHRGRPALRGKCGGFGLEASVFIVATP